MQILLKIDKLLSWGRSGFDADIEPKGACRVYSLISLNLTDNVIVANDAHYGKEALKQVA